MKKYLILFISQFILGHCAYAHDFSAVAPSGQTLYYNIVNGEASITCPSQLGNTYPYYGYSRPTGNLIIPDSVLYDGVFYTVSSIGENAFYNCTGLLSLIIPNTVTMIGHGAFSSCSGLMCSLDLPSNITFIGNYAFYGCSGLTGSLDIPSVTNIGESAFYGCSGLTGSLIIPNSITYICNNAFYECSGLTSLVIPNTVTIIGGQAFYNCSGLTSITMRCYPPSILSNTFSGFPLNIPITVPCGALTSYQNAQYWSNFTHFVEGCATITVTANDFTLGGVTGGGEYSAGDTVTLTAIPYSGSQFIGWSNGSQTNPLVFVATTNASYIAAFAADNLPPDTVFVHDTTYISYTIHDTIIQNIYDTVINIIHDTIFINNYIHDTLFYPVYIHDTTFVDHIVYDTVYFHDTIYRDRYIHDTIYVHDTVYIHDTIYIQESEGIDNNALLNAKIYQRNGQIVVEGAEGYPVYLYDVVGRLLATRRETAQEVLLDVPASGAYLVKIGDAPARRVVVRR